MTFTRLSYFASRQFSVYFDYTVFSSCSASREIVEFQIVEDLGASLLLLLFYCLSWDFFPAPVSPKFGPNDVKWKTCSKAMFLDSLMLFRWMPPDAILAAAIHASNTEAAFANTYSSPDYSISELPLTELNCCHGNYGCPDFCWIWTPS